jgi:putative FmdB family regulatory protein
MPRYQYECKVCGDISTVIHLMDETYEDCEKCESPGSMIKLLSTVHIKTKNKPEQTQKIGDLTNKFIEENRKILKQQHKESKGNTHDPS